MPSLTKNPEAAVDKHPSACLKFSNTTFKVTETQHNKINNMKTKQQSKKNIIKHLPLAMILALGVWSPVQAQTTKPAEGKKMMEHKMMKCCQSTNKLKGKMEADRKTQVSEVSAQISKMNLAAQDKKLGMMADIITQMVAQQKAMHAREAEMEKAMMVHMFMHMQVGKKSMDNCPMMKSKAENKKSPDTSGGE
jgi:uncharacterized protein HemX